MSVLYADTSALATAYLNDEPDHSRYRALLLDGPDGVLTSALTRVELASTMRAVVAAGRVRLAHAILQRFDAHCDQGRVTLLALVRASILDSAYEIVLERGVRAPDAVHLAVALEARDDEPDLVFVTRDRRQAAAAQALGLAMG